MRDLGADGGRKTKTETMTSPCDVQATHGTLWVRW